MINPKLNVGDTIVLLHMQDESMSPGIKGVVKSIVDDPFEKDGSKIISVDWENGSRLSLLSNLDAWTKDERKKITETERDKFFISNIDIPKYFNTQFLVKYLTKVRDSGIVNMFGASPYLWMGKERIEHEFAYHNFNEETQEKFDEMLEMSNEAQSIMINGTIKQLEKDNEELTIEKINHRLQKNASRIIHWYVNVLS